MLTKLLKQKPLHLNITLTRWMFADVFTLNLFCSPRSCLVEEEQEDSDDEQPSYHKTYKQQWVTNFHSSSAMTSAQTSKPMFNLIRTDIVLLVGTYSVIFLFLKRKKGQNAARDE